MKIYKCKILTYKECGIHDDNNTRKFRIDDNETYFEIKFVHKSDSENMHIRKICKSLTYLMSNFKSIIHIDSNPYRHSSLYTLKFQRFCSLFD